MRARALILAAGRGKRLAGLTDHTPKCLLSVRGKTLLDWQLDALRGAGIAEVAIVTGYRRGQVARPGLSEFHNPDWESTDMLASLACAAAWLRQGPCIVSYADIFYQRSAVAALLACSAPLAITYDVHWEALWRRRFGDPLIDAETFRLGPGGTLAAIGARPATLAEVEGQYMGLLRMDWEGWCALEDVRAALAPAQAARLQMTGALQGVIAAGRMQVAALPYAEEWGEVDCAADLACYE